MCAVALSPRTLQRGRCLGERLATAMLSRSPMRCGARVGFVHHHPTKRVENKGFRGEPPPRVVVDVTVLYNMVVVSHIIICIYIRSRAPVQTQCGVSVYIYIYIYICTLTVMCAAEGPPPLLIHDK